MSSFQVLLAIGCSAPLNFRLPDEFGIENESENSFDIIATRRMYARSWF